MFYSIGRAIASLDANNLLEEFEGVADRIQRSLLDVTVPQLGDIDLGVRAAPARMVGGDYVDVVPRPGKSPMFAIGDVSGKSLPAALRAMSVKYIIRALISVLDDDVALIVTRTNEILCDDIEPDSFVTFVVGTLIDNNRTLLYANAGHDPPLFLRARTGLVEEGPIGRLALGVEADVRYIAQRAPLQHGDVAVFYTDGFTEARSPTGEQFTLAHVKQGLMEFGDLPAQQMADALFQRIETHAAGTLNDDATILVIRVCE